MISEKLERKEEKKEKKERVFSEKTNCLILLHFNTKN